MKQEIHFKGLSLTPDDHHTSPGELSVCANVELHNGALRPSVINGTEVTYPLKIGNEVATLQFVHVTHQYKYLIATIKREDGFRNTTTSVYWFEEDGSHTNNNLIYTFPENIGVREFNAIGNTLVILTDSGICYAKISGGKYDYIGGRMPEIYLNFTLDWKGVAESEQGAVTLTNSGGLVADDDIKKYDIENKTAVTSEILPKVNKLIREQHEKGHFIFPFLVRYAYRLYDNKLIFHSAPILMACSSGHGVYVRGYNGGGDAVSYGCDYKAIANYFNLEYMVFNDSVIQALKKWEDIIKSVDIYISAPLYRYNAAGLIDTAYAMSVNGSENTSCILSESYCTCKRYDGKHASWRERRLLEIGIQRNASNYNLSMDNDVMIYLPMKSDEEFNDYVRGCSEFFLLKSVKPSEIPTVRTTIDIGEGVLDNITAKDLMTDDYHSLDRLIPKLSYVYNSRLNVANIEQRLFNGYHPVTYVGIKPDSSGGSYINVYYFIKDGARDIVVQTGGLYVHDYFFDNLIEDGVVAKSVRTPYIFYPNDKAYKAIVLFQQRLRKEYYQIELKPHPMLNGSVYFDNFNNVHIAHLPGLISEEDALEMIEAASSDNTVALPNKIYSSMVDNPFLFPLEGVNTVSNGSVQGIAVVTKALSPGQRGKFDLITFCTDGVWAMEVSSTGTFSNLNLISNEACVNPDSICQLNQTVLFASRRGISKVIGEDVVYVSDKLDGPLFNAVDKLPGIIFNMVPEVQYVVNGHPRFWFTRNGYIFYCYRDGNEWKDEHSGEVIQDTEGLDIEPYMVTDERVVTLLQNRLQPFDFFTSAKLFYDFASARVIALKEVNGKALAYVYSLTDNSWSTMLMDEMPLSIVNAYPYNYLQKQDGSLLYLNKSYDYQNTEVTPAIIITRSLAYSHTMQVIQAFQQINDCDSVPMLGIFASNDDINWYYIGRAQRNHLPYIPGRPYRFFRIAIQMNMKQNEQYSKLVIDIIEKYQKL